MSAAQLPALTATAFQFAAALDAYDLDLAMLVAQPADLACYERLSARVDEMRLYAGQLPQFAVAWVELLIRHFEITHTLWQVQRGTATADAVETMRVLQGRAVAGLRRQLLQFLSAP